MWGAFIYNNSLTLYAIIQPKTMSLWNFLPAPQNNLLKIAQDLVQNDPKLPDDSV